ncbi:MAG: molybdopterin molybdotransferase MoeA, partial [Gaiellaceae bacterium]|nr:molybdopterin molybdotransferase MoeA [Gaiellaceae bacterium]
TLPLAFRVAAGTVAPRPLPPGACAAIATGAAVPQGADAVVPIERTELRGESVAVPDPVELGANIRARGGDVAEGGLVLEAGAHLGPAQVGALAAAGVAAVACHARPRVAVVVTGSELREPGAPLEPGQIYESNRSLLRAALSRMAEVATGPIVPDDPDAHREALARGLECDVLVTSGGVSVGHHDLVRSTASELGVEEVFWGVAMKPGKPLSFGVRGQKLVFGLPGNPVSALVGALLFVAPALRALQGARRPEPAYELGVLGAGLLRRPERDELVRARRVLAGGETVLEPIAGQESHMIVRAAAADALVHVPRGNGELPAGSRVRYLPLA